MKTRFAASAALLALGAAVVLSVVAQNAPSVPAPAAAASEPAKEEICFESRKGATEVTKRDLTPGWPNVKCSPSTGAVLWYGDPYEGTVPMGKMPQMDNVPEDKAVVKPRSEHLNLLAQCGVACHNGKYPVGFPKNNKPTPIPTMEALYPDIKNLQHGRGRMHHHRRL